MKSNIQRICVKAKPSKHNHEFYEWQTASICMFVPENDKMLAVKKAREELSLRHWEFISYEDKSTLIEVRVKEEGGEVWDAYQYAKRGNIFFRVFPEHFGAGKFRPMLPPRITERFMDSVIQHAGGNRLQETEKIEGRKNADYLIGEFIFELKDLQQEGLEKGPHQQKLAELFSPYFPGKPHITIDTSILSKPDYLRYLDIISKPIKTQIKSASKQIKETRDMIRKPTLKGGIIFLNTGFGTFPHDEFARQVERFAKKDSTQFDAIVCISIWSHTNGFDTYIFSEFSPHNPAYKDVINIRSSFNQLFQDMMTDLLRGKLPESVEYSDPSKPVCFSYNGIDFNWCPPTLPLPWDDERS